jgi:hypothetical protein
MNEQIDWSKAPEGAEVHFPNQAGTAECFAIFREAEAYYAFPGMSEWTVWSGESKDSLLSRFKHSLRDWAGEGLPPVGLECETLWSSTTGEYVPVRIIAHDEDRAVVRFIGGERKGEYDSDRQHNNYGYPIFRPIRTAEQIAAEEREAAVKEMQVVVNSKPVAYMNGLYALYDAGYRKQVQP